MELHCPQCQHVLDQDNGHAYCPSCGKVIEMKALCPDCHQPLQVLKACGAVDYFCQHGHGLISKNALNSCWLNALLRDFYRLDVFTSLSTQPSSRRVVSISPALTCFTFSVPCRQ